MFGTLSYDRHRQESVFEAEPILPNSTPRTESSRRGATIHKACELCRARKLRCSGNPSGCDRCKASSITCRYPPRTFRCGRKRRWTPRTSIALRSSEFPVADSPESKHSDVRGEGDFSLLEWQGPMRSAGNAEDVQPLTPHKLHNANYGLDSLVADAWEANSYVPSNFAECNLDDILEASWQYSQSSLSGAGTPFGSEWSETNVDANPESSSPLSLSSSNSVEMGQTRAGLDEAKLPSNGHCPCLGVVARLLEQVETQSAEANTTIDGLLESCREPLSQRKTLLACVYCKARSEFILLLAMLAKSLATVCDSLVQRCIRRRLEGSHEQPTAANKGLEVRVGAYFVEDSSERSIVIDALIMAKLNDLHDFLTELKARAKSREAHLVFLLQVEGRVMDLKAQMPCPSYISARRRDSRQG